MSEDRKQNQFERHMVTQWDSFNKTMHLLNLLTEPLLNKEGFRVTFTKDPTSNVVRIDYYPQPPETNGDWIRSMTDEEIATVLGDLWPCDFHDGCPDGYPYSSDHPCRACSLAFLKEKRGTTGRELNPDAEAGEVAAH